MSRAARRARVLRSASGAGSSPAFSIWARMNRSIGFLGQAVFFTSGTAGRRGGTKAQVGFPEPNEYPQLYEFTDCTYDGTAFWLADDLTEVVDIQVRDRVNGSIAIQPAGRDGDLRADWNATVTPI